MRKIDAVALTSVVVSLSVAAPPVVWAGGDFVTWQGGAVGSPNDWGTAANWAPALVPNVGDFLTLPDSASNFTVDLGGNREVNGVAFSGATPYTVTGGAGDTLRVSFQGIDVDVASVTHTIETDVVFDRDDNPSTTSWDIEIAATLVVNGSVGEANGTQRLTKIGSGTLALNGAGTYTGGTEIIGGTLLANGASATGTGPVFVDIGATLGGDGGVASVDVNNGGTLAPGESIGVLTADDVNFAGGSTFAIEIASGGFIAGVDFDRLDVSGSVSLGGNFAVALVNGFIPTAFNSFTVLSSATLSGAFANIPNGARVPTAGGEGTFLVLYGAASNSVNLSNFQPNTPGDADGDGDVDLNDFNTLAANFGIGPNAPGGFTIGDFDLDGDVDLQDFNLLAANFGIGTEDVATLPEPGVLGVLVLASGAAGAMRRVTRSI